MGGRAAMTLPSACASHSCHQSAVENPSRRETEKPRNRETEKPRNRETRSPRVDFRLECDGTRLETLFFRVVCSDVSGQVRMGTWFWLRSPNEGTFGCWDHWVPLMVKLTNLPISEQKVKVYQVIISSPFYIVLKSQDDSHSFW